MQTLRQLLKEFALPFVVASAWTAYTLWIASTRTLALAVTAFSATFFFVSWLTGQYFRVRKQVKVDADFQTLELRLKKLADDLDSSVSRLHESVIGGEAFCVLTIANLFPGADCGQRVIRVIGDGPVYDVSVRIVDVELFERAISEERLGDQDYEESFSLGNFGALRSTAIGQIDLDEGVIRVFNLMWFTRNAVYSQRIRLRKIDDTWRQASITRIADRVFEEIDDCFREVDGTVDWDNKSHLRRS